jgi:hypothetical protein
LPGCACRVSLRKVKVATSQGGLPFIAIGIKLRGSDKQSSIWHHKEKE